MRSWAPVFLTGLVLTVGCNPNVTVEADGTSEVEFELPADFTLTLVGPLEFEFEGATIILGEGAEFSISTGPDGGTLAITDEIEIRGPAESSAGRTRFNGQLLPGSIYSFTLQELLGPNASDPVPLTGAMSVAASHAAAVFDTNGNAVLDTNEIQMLTYQASGPAPVWRAPLHDTVLGTISGTGYVIAEPFTVEFNGDMASVEGNYTASSQSFLTKIPLKLTMGATQSNGIETEQGTLVTAP